MKLRKGKTKSILEGSIDAALLAVEVYNKPRTTFRSQAYIVLMIIAWTRLFHAYFNKTIGCTAYGFLDHSLKEDCATIQSQLKGVSDGETKKIHP